MNESSEWLAKAKQSLQGAESEFANQRYDNVANRAYYACFQAAIAALIKTNVWVPTAGDTPSHMATQALFAGELIRRRKAFSAELGSVLPDLIQLRDQADYTTTLVSETRAKRALDKTRVFVTAVQRRLGGNNGATRSATSNH